MEHVINGAADDDDVVMAHIEDKISTYDLYGTPTGVLQTHGPAQCGNYLGGEKQRCALHNPTDHHMRDWPVNFRVDKCGLMERHCPHGIGHPDPDSIHFYSRHDMDYLGVHGCDGCCQAPDTITEEAA